MRTLLVVAILATSILAGCSNKGGGGDDGDAFTVTCSNGTKLTSSDFPGLNNSTQLQAKCPKGPGGNSTSNSTSRAPNVLPTLTYTIKDDGGNATNVTMMGTNLTFDASGTTDSDGTITGLAMTVTDSNGSRTFTLFDAATKAFTPKAVSFGKPGRVNVTIAAVDDRGGFATAQFQVFVNQIETKPFNPSGSMGTYAAPAGAGCAVPLTATGQTVAQAYYFQNLTFDVSDFAGFVTVAFTSGGAQTYFICNPNGTAISAQCTAACTSNNAEELPPAKGINNYYIHAYRTGAPGTNNAVITVHYEPKPAA